MFPSETDSLYSYQTNTEETPDGTLKACPGWEKPDIQPQQPYYPTPRPYDFLKRQEDEELVEEFQRHDNGLWWRSATKLDGEL